MEIADTISGRRAKIPLYARYGIEEAWLVDLTKSCLEIYRGPQSKHGRYKQVEFCNGGIASAALLPAMLIWSSCSVNGIFTGAASAWHPRADKPFPLVLVLGSIFNRLV